MANEKGKRPIEVDVISTHSVKADASAELEQMTQVPAITDATTTDKSGTSVTVSETMKPSEQAEAESAGLDDVQARQKKHAQHMQAVADTAILLESGKVHQYTRTYATRIELNDAAAACGKDLLRLGVQLEKNMFGKLCVIAADLLDYEVNQNEGSNGWAAAFGSTPEGKLRPRFPRKDLHEKLKNAIGYTKEFIEGNKARLSSIDSIVGPASKAAYLVQTGHNKCQITWYTRAGKLLETAEEAAKHKDAYRAVAMPDNLMRPMEDRGTKKTPNLQKNAYTDLTPMPRKYIESHFAAAYEGSTLNDFGLLARKVGENTPKAEKDLVETAISKLTGEQVRGLVQRVTIILGNPDRLLLLRKTAGGVADFDALMATIDMIVDGSGHLLSADAITAKRLGEDKAA